MAALWIRDQRDSHLRFNLTRDELLKRHQEYSDQQFSSLDIAGYVDGSDSRYAAVWVDLGDVGSPRADLSVSVALKDTPQRLGTLREQWMPYTWHEYQTSDKTPCVSMIWFPGELKSIGRSAGRRSYEHYDTSALCQTDISMSPVRRFSSYDELGFNGCWSLFVGIGSVEVHDLSIAEHIAVSRGFAYQGYSPASISVTWDVNASCLIAGSVWQRPHPATTGARLNRQKKAGHFDFASDFVAGLKLHEPVVEDDLHFVGDPIPISYRITNVAGRSFSIIFDEDSKVTDFLGTRQHLVQRLADPTGNSVKESQLGAGGYGIPLDPLVREGGEVVITDGLYAKDLKPGRYRAFVQLSATGNSIQHEESTEFDLLPLPQAVISTRLGDITVELFPASAPKAVENFLTHAKNGFYDETIFHAVAPDMAIQGGDPTGTGDHSASIWGKPFPSELDNSLSYKYGTLAMGNKIVNQNLSQFFIVNKENGWPELNGRFPIFGRVVDGFDTLEKIGQVDAEHRVPLEPIPMKITLKETAVAVLERIQAKNGSLPQVTIDTKFGTMLLTLFPDSAPNTVRDFLTRAREGAYDETTFDEVMAGSLVSAGNTMRTQVESEGDRTGQFEPEIDEELAMDFGMVALSRRPASSPGSRFFIIANKAGEHGKQSDFAIFGQIHRGFDVLEKLSQIETVDGRAVEPVPMTIELRESAVQFLERIDGQE